MAIMVAIGMVLRMVNLTDEPTMKKVDKLIFNVFMPMLSFYNIYKTDFSQLSQVGYIVFGFGILTLLFLGSMFIVPKLVKPMPTAASLGQAIFRSNHLISGVLLRLVLVPMAIMPLAILCGFRGQQLCALMILFAAPTAVSSYPMAVAMDADGDFAAQMVAYTTIFCLPTIFLWTLLLNSMGWM